MTKGSVIRKQFTVICITNTINIIRGLKSHMDPLSQVTIKGSHNYSLPTKTDMISAKSQVVCISGN